MLNKCLIVINHVTQKKQRYLCAIITISIDINIIIVVAFAINMSIIAMMILHSNQFFKNYESINIHYTKYLYNWTTS